MRSPSSAINELLVLRGGALGDFILTLPILQGLANRFPATQLNLVAQSEFLALAHLAIPPLSTHRLDHPNLISFFVRDSNLNDDWRKLFSRQDLIVSYLSDPDEIFRGNIARCGGAQFLQGPAKIESSAPATAQLAAPLAELGIAVRAFRFEFLEAPKSMVALHPGSGGKRKNWPIGCWLEFAEQLDPDLTTVVGGEADAEEIARFRERFPMMRQRVNVPLPKLAAELAGTIFLGHDSGISHLAAIAGAECLLLFGPTDPAIWAPRGKNVRLLRPVTKGLDDLSVAEVRAAYELMRIGIST